MTVGDLLRALDRVPGLAHSPLPGSGAALDAQCTGVTHDSRRVGRWRDFRGACRAEGERCGVRAAGDCRRRVGHRLGIARAG